MTKFAPRKLLMNKKELMLKLITIFFVDPRSLYLSL